MQCLFQYNKIQTGYKNPKSRFRMDPLGTGLYTYFITFTIKNSLQLISSATTNEMIEIKSIQIIFKLK